MVKLAIPLHRGNKQRTNATISKACQLTGLLSKITMYIARQIQLMDMKLTSLYNDYKNKPVFQAGAAIFILVAIIKIAMLGFEFGQWLKM